MTAHLSVALTVLLWAGSFSAIRAAVPHYGPLGLTAGRLLVAGAAFALLTPFVRTARPARSDWPRLAAAGLVGMTGYQAFLNGGQVRVSAATASVIIATAPLLTALLARLALGEAVPPARLWGASVAFTGVAIAAFGEGSGLRFEPASLLVLLAAGLHAAYFVIMKPLLRRMPALAATAWATWAAAAASLPLALALPRHPGQIPAEAHVALLMLGVGASALGFLLWSVALRSLDASAAAVYLYLVPPAAAVIAWLWLRELPPPLAASGGVVTLIGVGLAQLRGQAKPQHPAVSPPGPVRRADGKRKGEP